MKNVFLLLCLLSSVYSLAQNKYQLRNGTVLEGQIISRDENNIIVILTKDSTIKQVSSFDIIGYTNEESKTAYAFNNNSTAGDELIKAANTYYAGIGISIAGILSVALADQIYQVDPSDTEKIQDWNLHASNTMKVIGLCVSSIGVIVQVTAFSHVAKAGRKLNAIAGKNGVGISMKF